MAGATKDEARRSPAGTGRRGSSQWRARDPAERGRMGERRRGPDPAERGRKGERRSWFGGDGGWLVVFSFLSLGFFLSNFSFTRWLVRFNARPSAMFSSLLERHVRAGLLSSKCACFF